MKHRWWILLLTVSIGMAVEAWLAFKEPVAWESVGSLMVSGKVPGIGRGYEEERTEFYGTHLRMIQTAEVHDRTARRLSIEFPKLLGTVKISANVAPHTSIFYISGVGSNPEYTQKYVDTLLEEFIQYKKDQMRRVADVASQ